MSSDDSLQLHLDGMGYSLQAHDLKEGEHLVGSPTKLLSVGQIQKVQTKHCLAALHHDQKSLLLRKWL